MIKKMFFDAINGIDRKENLSKLRECLGTPESIDEVLSLAGDNVVSLASILSDSDPKVRKNAARFMGELDMDEFVEYLVKGYEAEEQMYVRSSYLKALSGYDLSDYLDLFKAQVERLRSIELDDGNRKHIGEELKTLNQIIVKYDGVRHHGFTGFSTKEKIEVIMLTNRPNRECVLEQVMAAGLDEEDLIPFKGGIRFKTRRLKDFLDIRTFSELLFVVPGLSPLEPAPEKAAAALAESDLVKLLFALHSGDWPFYFRLEVKSSMEPDKLGKFVKRMAVELENRTMGMLINSASNYEVEIRLIQGKDGNFNTLLKLYTLKDRRFNYFKNHIPASIKPVNAALMVELAAPYMAADAQVLDPFCGVGTMLIERQKKVKANTSYGIDFNGDAIEKAKENTELAGQIIHYVNRDFFSFSHEYLFDEIFTDMPFALGKQSRADIEDVYTRFFGKAGKVLKESGRVIMYSRNCALALVCARRAGYKLLAEFTLVPADEKTSKTEAKLMVFEAGI